MAIQSFLCCDCTSYSEVLYSFNLSNNPYSEDKTVRVSRAIIHSASEPAHKSLVLIALLSNKGYCESVHMCRLAIAFVTCIHETWI